MAPLDPRVHDAIDAFALRLRKDLETHLRGLTSDLGGARDESEETWRQALDRAVADAHADAEQSFRSRLEGLRVELTQELERLLAADRLEREVRIAAGTDRPRVAATSARPESTAQPSGREIAAPARPAFERYDERSDAWSRVLRTIRRLDEATSLRGILSVLARGVSHDVARVAIFIVEGDILQSWGHFGFATGFGPYDVPVSAVTPLASVLTSRGSAVVRAPLDPDSDEVPSFMKPRPGESGLIAPFVVGGDVVAVLYAEGPLVSYTGGQAAWASEVEFLVRHAGARLENVTSERTVAVLTRTF